MKQPPNNKKCSAETQEFKAVTRAYTSVDTQMAVYLVGVMALKGELPYIDLDDTDSGNAQLLLYIVQDVRDALRTGLREVDFVQLKRLIEDK